MEHLHQQRGRRVLLLGAVGAVCALAGCSDAERGAFADLDAAPDADSTHVVTDGVDDGRAVDRGFGVDGVGGGPLRPCSTDRDCGGGVCLGKTAGQGLCFTVCAAAPGVSLGPYSVQSCLRGQPCLFPPGVAAYCTVHCATAADCPKGGPVTPRCVMVTGSARPVCRWF